MRYLIASIFTLLICLSPAHARGIKHPTDCPFGWTETAVGKICVNMQVSGRFAALIHDLFSNGFRGPVSCYARGGHMRNSKHYSGSGCDFAQCGWNCAPKIMYRASAIIARHGLRDGCSFGDCGHVDNGPPLTKRHASRHHRFAHTRHVRYSFAR